MTNERKPLKGGDAVDAGRAGRTQLLSGADAVAGAAHPHNNADTELQLARKDAERLANALRAFYEITGLTVGPEDALAVHDAECAKREAAEYLMGFRADPGI